MEISAMCCSSPINEKHYNKLNQKGAISLYFLKTLAQELKREVSNTYQLDLEPDETVFYLVVTCSD
jgi:hypothetical protein